MQVRVLRRKSFPALRWGLLMTASLFLAGIGYAQTSDAPSSSTQDQQSSRDTDKKDSKPPAAGMTRLKIRVTTEADKPIANASVYVRFYAASGPLHHDKLQEMNFKTNQDGSVKVPEIPQGKILIQVIAPGWHTYGKWYDVDKEEESIAIKLVAPPHWY